MNMIYKYNQKELKFEKCDKIIKKAFVFTLLLFVLVSCISFKIGSIVTENEIIELEGVTYVINEDIDPFSREAFIRKIKDLKIKYPHIVMAQSIFETGGWKSHIFKENHNLFGMKEARSRISTAKGTQFNHAYYDNWQESLYDYAFYQSRYLSKINSENDYFNALDATYAQIGTKYSERLKFIIEKENLKELFDDN
jgi:hypothetical protein